MAEVAEKLASRSQDIGIFSVFWNESSIKNGQQTPLIPSKNKAYITRIAIFDNVPHTINMANRP